MSRLKVTTSLETRQKNKAQKISNQISRMHNQKIFTMLHNRHSDPGTRPRRGHFMVGTPEGCIIDVCTKFEADSSIRSKVIRGVPKFRNWFT